MEDKYGNLQRFFAACDEMIGGKFILADTKIGELLKSIAASEDLTGLFAAVTKDFDYAAAKKTYLRDPAESNGMRGTAYLPSERGEVLAFVFCLLVEFDAGTLRFNDFLLKYFYEDGSYTASYSLFVGRVIRPFRDIVRDCYPELSRLSDAPIARRREEVLDAIFEKVTLERARVMRLSLKAEDAVAGEVILAELYVAAGRRDAAEIKALLCGYLYFLRATASEGSNSDELFELAAEL